MGKLITSFHTLLFLILIGGGLVLAQATDGIVFFADDFSQDEVGRDPTLWRVVGGRDYIHVVSDPGVASGKAVRISSDPAVAHTFMNILPWDGARQEVDTVVIDHKVRWVQGKNNMYVTKSGSHRLHWWVNGGGQLQFNQRQENGTLGSVTVGTLLEGWNHIRLVASLEHQLVRFYLNDMDRPAGGPYRFGRELDSWIGATLSFSHTHSNDAPKEIYYSDIKVWEFPGSFLPDGDEYLSNAQLLFADDFSTDRTGTAPSGWDVSSDDIFRVVEDPEASGGKAVYQRGAPDESHEMSIRLSTSQPMVVVEHAFLWVGGNVGFYLGNPDTGEGINWAINGDSANVQHFSSYGGGTWAQNAGKVQEGWNRLRIVVDIERNEIYIYLNAMAMPVLGPLALQSPPNDWNPFVFTINEGPSAVDGSMTDVYHRGIKVWELDSDGAQEFRHTLGQDDQPIWIQYDELDHRESGWWASPEAMRLANRIVRMFESGEVYIDVPIGSLTVPDGILATQLNVLARVYARTGQDTYRQAFHEGLNLLLDAQYPSGGWPTVYPRYADRDLDLDMYAQATWNEIPSLLEAIISRTPPFNTDISLSVDSARLEEALQRIPLKSMVRRFSYAHYVANDATWWASEEAVRIGDNLISWQISHGGWWRDEAFAVLPYSPEHMRRGPVVDGVEQGRAGRNGTVNPLRFLARVYEATGLDRFKQAFYRGIDYLLDAQYPTGGWPNSYPNPQGVNQYVMYNDRAMVDVLTLFQDIVMERFPFQFVDGSYKNNVQAAYSLGIDYILNSQIEFDGRLLGWGHQHDPYTFEPRPYRSFEPPALSGSQTPNVVEFLMSIEDASQQIKQAILSALEWLNEVRLADGRWSVFYEVGTNRPIFAGRDGVIHYDLADIEVERQWGYGGWYGTWGAQLLARVKQGGYLDFLYASLPNHPTVRIKFGALQNGAQVSGVYPLSLALYNPAYAKDLNRVTIRVDDVIVYDKPHLPGYNELIIDTREFTEGRHTVSAEVVHKDLGTFNQSIKVNVRHQSGMDRCLWLPFKNPERLLLLENFTQDEFGYPPTSWTVSGAAQYIHVVSDPQVDSGGAVRILSDPTRAHTAMSAYLWNPPAAMADVIVIEHKLRWVQGKNNMYVTKSNSHRLHWWVNDRGEIQFNRGREDGSLSAVTVGAVRPGWNTIRLVASLQEQQVYFYINDMEQPVAGPFQFGRPIDSWEDARLTFSHTHSHENPKEIFYGDIKVWYVDQGSIHARCKAHEGK